MTGPRHRGHEGWLIHDQKVFVFKENWYVVRNRDLWRRDAIEIHHGISVQDTVRAKGRTALSHNLVRVEAGLQGLLVVVGVAMTLRADEIVYEVPRANWSFRYPSLGGV